MSENRLTKHNLKWEFGAAPVDGIALGIKLITFLSRLVLFLMNNFHTLIFVCVCKKISQRYHGALVQTILINKSFLQF